MTSWLFLEYTELDGATNMALDELLLERHIAGDLPPVLRLYGFVPPAVSIGYTQELSPQTMRSIHDAGFEVVRRPTGGRAVLHFRDLTYAFIGSEGAAGGNLSQSITGAYKQICTGIAESLLELGIESQLGESQSPYRHLSDCFLATTPADLHFKGKKIAGSAQLRRRSGVLQHGSLPLDQDQTLLPLLLSCPAEPAEIQGERHANLCECAGRALAPSELSDAFLRGFSRAFSMRFDRRAPTPEELESARSTRHRFAVAVNTR